MNPSHDKAAISWIGGKDSCLALLRVREQGMRARLVSVDTRWLDASFAGAAYDHALLARLPSCVFPCSEVGEFHSFVWDAPGFAAPLAVEFTAPRAVLSQPPLSKTTLILTTPKLV